MGDKALKIWQKVNVNRGCDKVLKHRVGQLEEDVEVAHHVESNLIAKNRELEEEIDRLLTHHAEALHQLKVRYETEMDDEMVHLTMENRNLIEEVKTLKEENDMLQQYVSDQAFKKKNKEANTLSLRVAALQIELSSEKKKCRDLRLELDELQQYKNEKSIAFQGELSDMNKLLDNIESVSEMHQEFYEEGKRELDAECRQSDSLQRQMGTLWNELESERIARSNDLLHLQNDFGYQPGFGLQPVNELEGINLAMELSGNGLGSKASINSLGNFGTLPDDYFARLDRGRCSSGGTDQLQWASTAQAETIQKLETELAQVEASLADATAHRSAEASCEHTSQELSCKLREAQSEHELLQHSNNAQIIAEAIAEERNADLAQSLEKALSENGVLQGRAECAIQGASDANNAHRIAETIAEQRNNELAQMLKRAEEAESEKEILQQKMQAVLNSASDSHDAKTNAEAQSKDLTQKLERAHLENEQMRQKVEAAAKASSDLLSDTNLLQSELSRAERSEQEMSAALARIRAETSEQRRQEGAASRLDQDARRRTSTSLTEELRSELKASRQEAKRQEKYNQKSSQGVESPGRAARASAFFDSHTQASDRLRTALHVRGYEYQHLLPHPGQGQVDVFDGKMHKGLHQELQRTFKGLRSMSTGLCNSPHPNVKSFLRKLQIRKSNSDHSMSASCNL